MIITILSINKAPFQKGKGGFGYGVRGCETRSGSH